MILFQSFFFKVKNTYDTTLFILCIFAIVRKKVIVSVTNDITTDQRVYKVCKSLLSMGFELELIGRLHNWSKPLNRDYPTHRINTIFLSGPLFYLEFNIRLLFLLIFKPCTTLLSNDLDTLPANYFASIIKNVPLVYDSHELFTEVPELMDRPIKKKLWKKIESFFLPKLKNSYTVCDSIAQYYNNTYGIKMKVIKNVPYLANQFTVEKTKTIIYQGNMNPGRGIDLAIRSMKYLIDFELKIIGNGPGFKDLKELAKTEKVAQRVVFYGRMNYDDMQQHTRQASLGILFEEPYGLSFQYCLPNKLFDYIHACTPVLATPLLEVKKVIDNFPVGEVLADREPKNIALQIRQMTDNMDVYRFEDAIGNYNWENEQPILDSIFLDK